MQHRFIYLLILLFILACCCGGFYYISTQESMTTNYAPAHFINSFNTVEGFADGEEEPQPMAPPNQHPALEELENTINIQIYNTQSPTKSHRKSFHPPPPPPPPTGGPITITSTGPYGYMPNYETIPPRQDRRESHARQSARDIIDQISQPDQPDQPDQPYQGDRYDMVYPPVSGTDQPYNSIAKGTLGEVNPAQCPVCPLTETSKWAEYKPLENDYPGPY